MLQKTYYKTKDYCKVKFSLNLDNANSVKVLGLNSDWTQPLELKKKKDGSFSADINLPKNSKHEFKYFVNESEWVNEPEADAELQNTFGGTNSVIEL